MTVRKTGIPDRGFRSHERAKNLEAAGFAPDDPRGRARDDRVDHGDHAGHGHEGLCPGRALAYLSVCGPLALDLGTAACLAFGGVVFLVSLVSFAMWARRQIDRYSALLDPVFPTPPTDV